MGDQLGVIGSGLDRGFASLRERPTPRAERYELGRRLRIRRRLMGMTLQDVGDRAGVRMQQVQKYEAGANRVSAVMLWRLSGALGVPPAYFFEGLPPDYAPAPLRPAA